MMNWRDDGTQAPAAEARDFRPWQLCLYVAGSSPRSEQALTNLRTCCEQHLAGQYELEILDVQKHPEIARRDQVLALPLLVRRQPSPRQYLIGELSDPELLLRSLSAALPC